jgi:hypothetical protein
MRIHMMLMPESSFLRAVPKPGSDRRGLAGVRAATGSTLDEERREIVAAVLETLAGTSPDPDEMAACSYLLRHLSEAAIQYGPRAA